MSAQINIKKILILVDFSEYSRYASRFAFTIAEKAGAELIFFHALYSPAFDLIELSGNRSTRKLLKEDVSKKLISDISVEKVNFIASIKKFPELKAKTDADFKFHFSTGQVKEEILTFSEGYQPDLVILGIRGENNNTSSVLGSVTEYVIKKLISPVLAIPLNYNYSSSANYDNILYLTDFDESDFLSIRRLMGFTKLFGLKIHCVHVDSHEDVMDIIKMEGLRDYFKIAYKDIQIECKTMTMIEKKNKIDSIENYVRENKIGMISLTTRKRNLIEKYFKPNPTKKLFYQSNIPLLIFHS